MYISIYRKINTYVGTPYRGKHFWIHQIPTSCLPTLLIFIHIEHICSFFVAFFSAIIDGRNLIFGHKLHIDTPYRTFHFDLPKKKTWLQWAILGFLMTETLIIFFSETTSKLQCSVTWYKWLMSGSLQRTRWTVVSVFFFKF
jgi:hypothetical protein